MGINNMAFPFNNTVETALRTLSVLDAIYPKSVDLELLVCLDYICVHSADFFEGTESLHPENPNRTGEVLVRRTFIEDALNFLHAKNLICVSYLSSGIEYKASDMATSFLDRVSAPYSKKLIARAILIGQHLQQTDNATIARMVKAKTFNYAFQSRT